LRQFNFAKKIVNQTVIRKKLGKTLSNEKSDSKMLVTLIPGVNFTNILSAAITLVDPKSVKIY